MPYKDQLDCYRTIKGVKWPCIMDVIGPEQEAELARRREAKHRLRVINHKDGFQQVFCHPEDLNK